MSYIFICNSAIEGLSSSSSLNINVKNQLLGEAKFMRAFVISIWSIYLEMCHWL